MVLIGTDSWHQNILDQKIMFSLLFIWFIKDPTLLYEKVNDTNWQFWNGLMNSKRQPELKWQCMFILASLTADIVSACYESKLAYKYESFQKFNVKAFNKYLNLHKC